MNEDLSLFDEFLDPVLITDFNKNFIYANSAFLLLFQTTLRKLKKTSIEEYINFTVENVFLNKGISLNPENTNTQIETEFKTIDNISGTVLVITKKQEDGHVINFLRDMALEVNLHGKYHAELAENEKLIAQLRAAKKKLEVYNKNLEKIVEKRTADLKRANQYLKTMANSIGQALLMFNESGVCLPVYTKTVTHLFGVDPTGENISDVLLLSEKDKKSFHDWCQITFQGMIPFKDTLNLSLRRIKIYKDETERLINLEYFPVKNSKGQLVNIVLVGTDVTEEELSKKELEEQNKYVTMILKIIENKESFVSAFKEARDFLNQALKHLDDLNNIDSRNEVNRHLHSIKGICSLYEINEITSYIHNIEQQIAKAEESFEIAFPPDIKNEISKKIEKLSEIILSFAEEIAPVIGDAILTDSPTKEIYKKDIDSFYKMLQTKDGGLAKDFQKQFKSISLNYYFKGYELLLQSLAKKLSKKIKPFQIIGGEISIPDNKYQDVFNVFSHLFRNCLDHGIETPDERIQLGKDPEGQISLKADIIGNELVINISDDGSGIDQNRVRRAAVKVGIDTEKMTEAQIKALIFSPRLSTASEKTEVSGQGMGMSAVKDIIEKNNGNIEVFSSKKDGTTYTISLKIG